MIGEDLRQYRRTRRLAVDWLVTVVLLSMVAAASGLVAVRQRDEARSQRREAEDQRATAERERAEAVRQRDLANVRDTSQPQPAGRSTPTPVSRCS